MFWSIYFNTGFINSSAIRRYFELHPGTFTKTTGLNDKIPRATSNIQRSIIDESDTITEEASKINAHDVIREASSKKNTTITSPSSLWRFIRLASETYFTEIRFTFF